MLAEIIKTITNTFGFTINRTHTGKNLKFDSCSKPLYIEFIGISGVGKTTLYNALKKERGYSVKWIERYDFLSFQPKVNLDESINSTYLKMLESKSQNICSSDLPVIDKIKLGAFFYQNIQEEVAALLYNKNATLINEDGLFHNFGKEIRDIYKDDPKVFSELSKNRAIVFCTNSAENIAKQIQKRNTDSHAIRPHHRVASFQELVEIQKPLLQDIESFVRILEENNLPVLYITTSDDISENAHKVNLYIKELQLKQK